MSEVIISNYEIPQAHKVMARLATERLEVGVSVKWLATKVATKLEELIKLLGKSESDLMKKYAKLDESGEFIPAKDKEDKDIPNTWVFADASDESKQAFGKEHQELMEAKNTLVFDKIKLDRLEKTDFTGVELMAIQFIIDADA